MNDSYFIAFQRTQHSHSTNIDLESNCPMYHHQREGIKYGLGTVEQLLIEQGRNFQDFDTDGDNWIDSFTVIHSGFDASTNDNDCYAPDKKSGVISGRYRANGVRKTT